ncbi:stalk domain-containing protein [Paenibacillus sp. CAU 1782]
MKVFAKTGVIVLTVMLLFTTVASAHSGRTDANGGHNCSQKSKDKGLCTGYHYHNSGKSSGGSSSSSGTSSGSESSSSSKGNTTGSNSSSSGSKSSAAQYSKSSVQLYVNDKQVALKTSPLLKDNTNYFPIKETAEALGATAEWDSAKSTLTIAKDKKKLALDPKKDKLLQVDATDYAPIRIIVEGLGGTLTFDKAKNTIFVKL